MPEVRASPSSVAFYERRAYVAQQEVRRVVGDAELTYVAMRKQLA